jgi:type IV secretory pathway VirB10-like protein
MILNQLLLTIGIVICFTTFAIADMYEIKNPADKIKNPADKMFNPASQNNNPASNIYNPASRMNEPNPISSPTQPIPPPTAAVEVTPTVQPQPIPEKTKPAIPHKSYKFKLVKSYFNAIKKAFAKDDYIEFLSLTEDALRKINNGTLKASKKEEQKLLKYKIMGYGLLEETG